MWSFHEEIEGVEDWSGNRDLRKFIELCGELGLKVHLRAGPYCKRRSRTAHCLIGS